MINLTTGGAPYMKVDERVRPAEQLQARGRLAEHGLDELRPLPDARPLQGVQARLGAGRRLETSRDLVFRNTFAGHRVRPDTLGGAGTRFEFECYDICHLYNLHHFLRARPGAGRRCSSRRVFGILGGIGPHPEDVMHMKRTADRLFGDHYQWSVLGAGKQPAGRSPPWPPPWAATCASAWRTRCGSAKGRLADSNAQQVRGGEQVIEGSGPTVATPDEAREILSLKGGDQGRLRADEQSPPVRSTPTPVRSRRRPSASQKGALTAYGSMWSPTAS